MWFPIALALVLLAWFPFYVYAEYRWEKRKYFFVKVVASLLFLSIAVSAFLTLMPSASYALWIIAALAP